MKVGIVGAGMVGSAAAYAMVLRGAAQEIILIDKNTALATAQAQDISHSVPFAYSTIVRAGDYEDLGGVGIVIIAAGVSQKPGETRIELLSRNAKVFEDVITRIMAHAPHAILLIASNPVDIMTHIAQQISGLPAVRVIGSGTILDSARFRSLLGKHLGISPQSVHAYVLGEHGDSEVLAWSSARAGALPLPEFAAQVGAPLTSEVRQFIDHKVRHAAYEIIDGKGATNYGIGAGLCRMVQAISQDEQAVLSVSVVTHSVHGVEDVALSLPRVVGAKGVTAHLFPKLDETEIAALTQSANVLKDLVGKIEKPA